MMDFIQRQLAWYKDYTSCPWNRDKKCWKYDFEPRVREYPPAAMEMTDKEVQITWDPFNESPLQDYSSFDLEHVEYVLARDCNCNYQTLKTCPEKCKCLTGLYVFV